MRHMLLLWAPTKVMSLSHVQARARRHRLQAAVRVLLQAQKLRKQLQAWQSCVQHTALRLASASAGWGARSLAQSLRAWRVRCASFSGHALVPGGLACINISKKQEAPDSKHDASKHSIAIACKSCASSQP